MTRWLRPTSPQYTRWCSYLRTDNGSTVTHCNDRWEVGIECESGTDPEPKCKACVDNMAMREKARGKVLRGIAELRGAVVVPTVPQPLMEFDMTDADGEG